MKKEYFYIFICLLIFTQVSCYKIPEEGTISDNMAFSLDQVTFTLGRQTIVGDRFGQKIVKNETTIPFQFEVAKVTKLEEDGTLGNDVTDLFTKEVETEIWKSAFSDTISSQEEWDSRRKKENLPVLSFTKANELFFNNGTDDIEPGSYSLDVLVRNASGKKLYSNIMTLNIMEKVQYLSYTNPGYYLYKGVDQPSNYELIFTKKGDNENKLSIVVEELDGTLVPIDSLRAASSSYSLSKMFSFKKEVFADRTEYILPYPVPYVPGNIYKNISRYSGLRAKYYRYGLYYEEVEVVDEEGNVVVDEEGNPVTEMKWVEKMRYGFMFYFYIFEPGDWEIKIKLS